ncbi:MAG: thiamine-phosphate kinase [Pseudomonadota bacterium]
MARPGEFEIIEEFFAPLAGEGSFGFKDDAAKVTPAPGHILVVTQDAIAEGIHFFPDDLPDLIAKKALRVNLSDLAAKGATPKCFSLALGLGEQWSAEWVSAFARGLGEDCQHFDIALNGGDTFKTGGGFVISITAIGEMPEGEYVSRLGANVDDALFVTGTIGDGALGLLARQNSLNHLGQEHADYLTDRYLLPRPRTGVASVIRRFASAAMDISDGLVGDLEKLCAASGVSANVELPEIPLSTAVEVCISHESEYLKNALTGGDDYEILLTVPQDKLPGFETATADLNFPVTRIGTISQGAGVTVFDKDGSIIEFEKTSYDHSE